jgi:D-alanyl-D-alanine carboxypeptidase/D-alanyl-D-alanine-endopeptidase (penicillin-binding protein 4)
LRFFRFFLVVSIATGPACAARTAGPPPAALSPARALAADLDRLFVTSPADRVSWGVVVRDPATGEALYRRDADRLLHPASNMKLLTLAAAAARLGWDFRFETVVRATTPVERDGTLRGDLVVIGSGDPTIGRRFGGAATLADWADRIRAQGVRRIEGRIIGDDTAAGGTWLGDGWQWDDLAYGYAAPPSGLTYNENTAEILIAPGASAGARANVTLADRAAGLTVVNEIRTVASGSARRISLDRAPDGSRLTIAGEVPLGYAPFRQYVAIGDPPGYFARALRETLRARGIAVIGGARSAATDPPGPFAPDAPVLVRHASPPLREMAVTLMKVSQNLYAEVLLHALGRQGGTSGAAAVSEILASWGAGAGTVVAADGSGLSRYDLASAAALDMVLTRMFQSAPDREPWLAALPVAGVDGTLERRMRGSRAEGRVRAKTGSIAYVRALSGYVQTAGGAWLQFVILANNFAGPVTNADVDRITEEAVGRLVDVGMGKRE